jgi:formylglycine-generating enzyme required for sulfatase activity
MNCVKKVLLALFIFTILSSFITVSSQNVKKTIADKPSAETREQKNLTNKKNNSDSYWVSINPTPTTADIYLDSILIHTGICKVKLKPGTYQYNIEASQYHGTSGELVVVDKDVALNVKLLPAYGSISINCKNETGARVYLDGKEVLRATPCLLEKIASGEHRILVTKLNYQAVSEKVYVVDAETYNLELALSPSRNNFVIKDDENSVQKNQNEKLQQPLKKLNVNVDMVFVKGGTFLMGTDHEIYPSTATAPQMPNTPKHEVTLKDFYIGKTEVTQALWTKIMGMDSYYQKNDSLPVSSVSWMKVEEFINKLNELTGQHYRLPTEAEWEYAAGGGERVGTIFSGTNSEKELGDYAWTSENANGAVHAVATKKPNRLGLYDMSGNLWEWCNDWLGPYSKEPQVNPQGAIDGIRRAHRGGSWINPAFIANVKRRGGYDENSFTTRFGFRLAMSVSK